MRIGWFIREALISLRRNWVMSLAAITTVTLSLLVVGVFVFVALTLNNLIQNVEQQVEITVFLRDEADIGAVTVLQEEIVGYSEVSSVKYVSKEEALERFKQRFADRPDLIESLPGNPLPASFEIRLKDTQLVDQVATRFEGREDVIERVQYGKEYVEKLFRVTSTLRYLGAAFIGMLIFAALALITITIRLAIIARQQEVAIMKLVGASNWFIRFPFILEGCTQGLIGAGLAVAGMYVLQATFFETIKEAVVFLPIDISQTVFWQLAGGLIAGGIFIGAAGSGIALRRFLKV